MDPPAEWHFPNEGSCYNITDGNLGKNCFPTTSMDKHRCTLNNTQTLMEGFSFYHPDYLSSMVQNSSNTLLYVKNSQNEAVGAYQTSAPPNDPFHYVALCSPKNGNTGYLAIAPKPSPPLRSILPADFMPSITLQTLETPARMSETRLDTNVHFSEKQHCLPLNWEAFGSGYVMMDYRTVYGCINDATFQPQLDVQEDMQFSIAGSQTSLWDPKSKKPCTCTKSQCLKLYCDCFANGEFCNNCNCNNCCNNLDNKEECIKAIRACLHRNPEAFQRKISKTEDVKSMHAKGCKCKRSGCLKNYCECYEGGILCSSNCKCIGCKNYEESPDCITHRSIQKHLYTERLSQVFTSWDVVGAICACLLAQAEKAEKENQSACVEEKVIIEEFGNCLVQMLQTEIQGDTRD